MSEIGKRLEQVIEKDRLLISGEARSLIVYDLKRLLDNYFSTTGETTLEVSAERGGYLIRITARASGIKPFGTIK